MDEIRIRKKRLWVVGAAMILTSLLACMCTLDRSPIGSPPAVHTFEVVPRNLVCGSEIDQVSVSWSVSQQDGCTFSPSLSSCDAITEFFVGCPSPPPICNTVEITSSSGGVDPAVPPEESEGSRTVTITETTTFTMSVNGEERESVTVEVLNTGDMGPGFAARLNRTCVDGSLEVEWLDLTQMFSQCVQVGPLCNVSDVPIVIMNRETREEHRLPAGACSIPLGQPEIWLVREDMIRLDDPCAGMTDGSVMVPGDPPEGDLPPLLLGIAVQTCGTWDAEEEACMFTTTEPVIYDPPTPTAPAGGGSGSDSGGGGANQCAANGGIANVTDFCTCQGTILQVTYCGDGTESQVPTDATCVPDPADCQPTPEQPPPCTCNFVCDVADPNKPEQCLQGHYEDCNGLTCKP